MAIISSLTIKINTDVADADRGLDSLLGRLGKIEQASGKAKNALGSAATKAMSAIGGAAGPTSIGPAVAEDPQSSNAESSAAETGARISASLTGAMHPLETIMGKFGAQFNQLSGTLTVLARRIDSSMKFPTVDKFLKKVATDGPNAFVRMAAGAARSANRLHGFFTSIGDVSKKSMDQINRTTFVGPISGAINFSKVMNNSVTKTVNNSTSSMRGFGKEVLLALGVFGLGFKMVEFFKKGIKGAIDLNETISKTKEVFGGSTDKVMGQANQMAKAFGLPKGAMLDAASSYGMIASGAGLSADAAASMSNRMVKLAADASSFSNVPLEEAMAKIRSGLKGSYEPMLGLNALMSEETVRLEAVRLGLVKGKREMDERTKIVARASLMETKLAAASGDLERTQGGAANQFRKAGGGLDNFATSMGTLLLPAVTAGITVFNEFSATIIEVIESNSGVIEGFVNGIKFGFEVIGVILRNFGLFWEIAKIKAAEFATNTLAQIKVLGPNLVTIFSYAASAIWTTLGDLARGIFRLFIAIGKNIWAVLKGSLTGEKFSEIDFSPLLEGFKSTVKAMPDLLQPELVSMRDQIDAVSQKIADKEGKRAANLAKITPRAKQAKIEPKVGEKNDVKFAGAFEAGSKDAYSAIVQAKGQQGNRDPNKEVAVNTRAVASNGIETNRHLAKMVAALTKATAPLNAELML